MPDPNDSKRFNILGLVVAFYVFLGVLGCLISHYVNNNLSDVLSFRFETVTGLPGLSSGLLLAAILILSSHVLEHFFASFRGIKIFFRDLLGSLNQFQLIFLAALSSMTEELFFRAALQPIIGLFPTALVFGLLHIGPDRRVGVWASWAFLAGISLGVLFEYYGSLLACFLTHFLVNAYGMLRIKHSIRPRKN